MSKIDIQIIIGSKSDEEKIKPAIDILKDFNIAFDLKTASAHRSPEYVGEIINSAVNSSVKVFITGAGMANHLSGTVAARTTLPVIGIPFSGGVENGLDSLLSTLQMPPGIPVATVGIDNAKNAALLAISILALNDKALERKLIDYRKKMKKK